MMKDSRATDGRQDRGRVMVASDAMPERNGVGAYYRDLIEQLRARGWQVGFVGPSPSAGRQIRMAMPGDVTQRLWLPNPRRVARAMRQLQPQLMVVATPGAYGMLACRWAKRLGIPLVVGFHTDFPGLGEHYRPWLLRYLGQRFFLMVDRWFFRSASRVLANSRPMIDLAHARGARRAELVGTMVPLAMLTTPPAPLNSRLEHVLYAGRLAPEKNIQAVIDAARALPDIRFTIAGDGPLHGHVAEEARRLPNLHCTGWITRETLMACMDSADLLVLPSQLESFGNVALEAMARQRLVLVSRGCGIIDWPSLAQSLFCLEESQTLAGAIDGIARLPLTERQARAAANRRAAEQLNADSLAQWERLFDELLAHQWQEAG